MLRQMENKQDGQLAPAYFLPTNFFENTFYKHDNASFFKKYCFLVKFCEHFIFNENFDFFAKFQN